MENNKGKEKEKRKEDNIKVNGGHKEKLNKFGYPKKNTNKYNMIYNRTIQNYGNNKKLLNIYEFLNYILILCFIISSHSFKDIKKSIFFNDSFITLKIKQKGNMSVYYSRGCTSPAPFPDEIYINEVRQNQVQSYYYFNDTKNIIKLLWKDSIEFAACMFLYCSNITEINLSNFDTSKITYMNYMFYGCSLLTSLDLSNFDTSSNSKNFATMFRGCSSLKYINLKNSNIKSNQYQKIFSGISENTMFCGIDNKSDDFFNEYNQIINCDNENKCYHKKLNSFNYNDSCLICGVNYYQKKNDLQNDNSLIYCYKPYDGYYLDINDNIYKKCYSTCKRCDREGNKINHNCIECKDNYKYKINFEVYYNCYKNSLIEESTFIYLDNNNKYILDLINNQTSEKDVSKSIIGGITSGSLNEDMKKMLHKNSTHNITINLNNNTLHYISGLSQMMERIDISSVNFGECESLLKKNYSFTNIEDLIMYKIEYYIEGFKIPILEYSLFLYQNDKTIQLDLDLCNNVSIIYYIPINIDGNEISKYNPESDVYKDKCNTYKSESGTDMSLYDRINNFNINNMSLCEKNCSFLRYEINNSRVACECKIKNEFSFSYNETNINDLLTKLEGEKSKSNLDIISCNVLGSIDNIESNTGFYLLLLILAIFIIVFLIFCTKGYNLLEDKIDTIINKNFKNLNNKNKKRNTINSQINKPIKNNFKRRNIMELPQQNFGKRSSLLVLKKKRNNYQRNVGIENKKHSMKNTFNLSTINKKNKTKKKSNLTFKPDTDYELNWLSYEDSIKHDKRSGCDYYCSLIKSKQIITFTFCTFNDYNSGIIKKYIFFLSFALHYTINALFFTDSTMHQIYEDKGKYNFEYQLPKILYSALFSSLILRIILQTLVLTDKDILQVKLQQTKEMAIKMKKEKLKCMKIKFSIFFILNFILLGLFWYYLTAFNAIYKNTQIYLIENTFISFGFSLFYPFIINIFPMIIRMCSLHSSNKDQKYFYKVSQIIQLI